jgi:hypothetical protein
VNKKLQRYIEKQPQLPDGFQYETSILVSDSKGYTLRNACLWIDFPLETWCISGATTETLMNLNLEWFWFWVTFVLVPVSN